MVTTETTIITKVINIKGTINSKVDFHAVMKCFLKSIPPPSHQTVNKITIDCHINNFTALPVVGVGVEDFDPLLPLPLYQTLKSGDYLKVYILITHIFRTK
jgi:hypothetical protein